MQRVERPALRFAVGVALLWACRASADDVRSAAELGLTGLAPDTQVLVLPSDPGATPVEPDEASTPPARRSWNARNAGPLQSIGTQRTGCPDVGFTTRAYARDTGNDWPWLPANTIVADDLTLLPGATSRAAMIAGIERGLYITDMIGSGVNGVTGDYSRGASGFWIDKGELTFPVSEITVAGNLVEMYRGLTPADDLEYRFGINAPTVMIEGLTIAGR